MNGKNSDTPLVLVGHSMGGLVIKKAFLLAKHDPIYQTTAERIHSIYFLATPHRGADSAEMLGKLLKLSAKAYVGDLVPGSVSAQVINDDFRNAYQGVQLWSFFETVATSLGLIVERDSAVLGLPGERIQLLNADHRHVCKFNNPSDSNYCALRNAFSSTITSIEWTWFTAKKERYQTQMRELKNYLALEGTPESDLASITSKQMQGSCSWLTNKVSFEDWLEGYDAAPRFFRLVGEPATGKSTIAGHVVKYLEHSNLDCAYFFFTYGDSTKSSAAELLRSIAWQMSSKNAVIRQELWRMFKNGESFDKSDERSIWRSIFLGRIFQLGYQQVQYWVIDGLDECVHTTTLFALLAKIQASVPLRIFVTSRPSLQIEKSFSQEKISSLIECTDRESSLSDIRLYLNAHSQYLPVDTDEERESLINQLLSKSDGNFLRATLVLKELEACHRQEHIQDVLESVQLGMDELYLRMLNSIAETPRNVELAKSVLRWVVCAARPLFVEELKEAMRLDINQVVPRLEQTVSTICANLVYVDQEQKVHIAHSTVRAFLVHDRCPSLFAITRFQAQSQVAEICLRYLCSDEMKTSYQRRGSASARPHKRSIISPYAATYFSEHLARSSAARDEALAALSTFLRGNSLTWIETIAESGNLNPLILTAKNFKVFLERRFKYRSPLGEAVSEVSAWSDDLIHIVAQFGKALLLMPTSIHTLIPPMCPRQSIIYRSFGCRPHQLTAVGLSQEDWNDQLNCTTFPNSQVFALATTSNRFAVGLSDRSVRIINEATFQQELTLSHPEPVRHLTFVDNGSHLAAGGRKQIRMFKLASGTALWTVSAGDQIIGLDFSEDGEYLLAATRSEALLSWQVNDGKQYTKDMFSDTFEYEDRGKNYRKPPSLTVISSRHNLLAVIYRSRPISFWDLEEFACCGQFHRTRAEFPMSAISFVFNPNLEVSLAAAAYHDGAIYVFDPFTQGICATADVGASVIASSPDGTILAAGNGLGIITLYDFETLRILYRVESLEADVRSIAFNSTGLRFLDIRGDRLATWEPSVLVRRTDTGDDSSLVFSEDTLALPVVASAHFAADDLEITAMTAHHSGQIIFYGRENGKVSAFSCPTGASVQDLFNNGRNVAVRLLAWDPNSESLASVDISGRIVLYNLHLNDDITKTSFIQSKRAFEHKSSAPVDQILFTPDGNHLLVATVKTHTVRGLQQIPTSHLLYVEPPESVGRWFTSPKGPDNLFHVSSSSVNIFTRHHAARDSWSRDKVVKFPDTCDLLPSTVLCSNQGYNVCVGRHSSRASVDETFLRIWPLDSLTGSSSSIKNFINHASLAKDIKVVVGVFKSFLLFLDHDGWVCSIDIDHIGGDKFYKKHFFIPLQLHTTTSELLMLVTSAGSVALVVEDELAIFHHGLEHEEKVGLDGAVVPAQPSFRSSFSRGHSDTAVTSGGRFRKKQAAA
jgi:hypothetical protein